MAELEKTFIKPPDDADFSLNLDGTDYPMIDEDIWDSSLLILDQNEQEIEVDNDKNHTSIYCPFHDDNNPSAFLDYSLKSMNHFIFCSTCNNIFWKRKNDIPLEDRCVPFWSIGQNIIETGISNGKFFISGTLLILKKIPTRNEKRGKINCPFLC